MSQAKTREERRAEALAVLQEEVGTWDAEVEVRPGPGAEVVRFKAVSRRRLIAGGRWLVTEYEAETGFEGHGVSGVDESGDGFVSTWVDSQQTAIARGTGSWDAAARVMTFELQSGQARYREVTRRLEDGRHVYSNLVPSGDTEFELIRATYKRRG